MFKQKLILTAALLATGFGGFAQQLPMPRNIEQAYASGTRSADGRPGQNYWQNTADYNIKVAYNPETRLLNGTVDIAYTNNSPDTLKQILFKLYPNVYQKGAARASSIDPADASEGVQLSKLSINNAAQDVSKLRVSGTNLPVRIQPLAPKGKANISIA